MVSVALLVPAIADVNITLSTQLMPDATVAVVLQVELEPSANSFASAPPMAMETIVRGALPLLVRVMAEAGDLVFTFSPVNATVTPGAKSAVAPDPVPANVTVCVLLAMALLLSVTVRMPVRVPMAAGVKVTVKVQLAPAATEVPQ